MESKIKGLLKILLILFALHLTPYTLHLCCAQTVTLTIPDFYYDVTRGIGPRAIGMAGAFTGIADDPYAFYWNPAGLAFVERHHITDGFTVNNAKYWDSHIGYNYSLGAINIMRRDESGKLSWDGNAGKGIKDTFIFSQAIPLGEYFSMGFNLKGISANAGDSQGYGVDIGLLWKTKVFRLGVMIQDIYTKIGKQMEGVKYRIGVGIGPFSTVMIGSQIEIINVNLSAFGQSTMTLPILQVRTGVEGWLLNNHLGLRAGYLMQPLALYNSFIPAGLPLQFSNQQAITVGVSFKFKYFSFDYAYMTPIEANGEINNSHWITTSFMWGKTKADVAAEEKAKMEALERDRKAREMMLIASFSETITQKNAELEALRGMRGSRDEAITKLEEELEKVKSDSFSIVTSLTRKLDNAEVELEKVKTDSQVLGIRVEKLKVELLSALTEKEKIQAEGMTEKEKAEALKERLERMRSIGIVDPLLKEAIAKGIAKEVSIRDVPEGLLLRFSRDFFFSGSSLEPVAYRSLDVVIKALKDYPGHAVTINGYTDSTGSKSGNLKISAACAKAVVSYFIAKGISEDKVFTNGYGPDNPIAPNTTKTGRNQNRRVEIIIYKQ